MKQSEAEATAIAEVKKRMSSGKKFEATAFYPDFFDGSLVYVGYMEGNEEFQNLVLARENDSSAFFYNEDELIKWVAQQKTDEPLIRFLLRKTGIAGALALLFTGTVIYIVIHQPGVEIPAALSQSLAVIIGFYFGSSKIARH